MEKAVEAGEKVKREYICHIIEKLKTCSKVVIYGAGRKGMGLYYFLKNEGINIDAFCVTSLLENKENECGLSVFEIEHLPFEKKETLILIGVRKRWNEEIIRKLKYCGYENYLIAPEGIEYFLETDYIYSQKRVLQITAQVGCSIDCKFCPQNVFIKEYVKEKERPIKFTFNLFQKYLDRISKDTIIDFAGYSEIFLNKDGIKMIEYAFNCGYEVELYTTLVGLTIDEFARIKDLPFREVVLHLPDKSDNSKIHVSKEYLNLLRTVLNAHNGSKNEAWADWGSCHGEPSIEIEDMIRGKIRTITKLHDRAGNLNDDALESKKISNDMKIFCTKANKLNHNILLPDGTVLLCDSDWGMRHVIGNLNESTYEEILRGDKVLEIKQAMLKEKNIELLCRSCCYAIGYKEE